MAVVVNNNFLQRGQESGGGEVLRGAARFCTPGSVKTHLQNTYTFKNTLVEKKSYMSYKVIFKKHF